MGYYLTEDKICLDEIPFSEDRITNIFHPSSNFGIIIFFIVLIYLLDELIHFESNGRESYKTLKSYQLICKTPNAVKLRRIGIYTFRFLSPKGYYYFRLKSFTFRGKFNESPNLISNSFINESTKYYSIIEIFKQQKHKYLLFGVPYFPLNKDIPFLYEKRQHTIDLIEEEEEEREENNHNKKKMCIKTICNDSFLNINSNNKIT